MAHGTFVTAINCMDGRVQLPVMECMKRRYGVEYVDCVTEPGPIKILDEKQEEATVASIRRRVDISVTKHGSKAIAVVAHYDCAGNPVDKPQQMKQLAAATRAVAAWGYKVPVLGLWVDEHWTAHLEVEQQA